MRSGIRASLLPHNPDRATRAFERRQSSTSNDGPMVAVENYRYSMTLEPERSARDNSWHPASGHR
ncbi:hypothetical protein AGR8A_pTi20127 [Agrobacterium fabrum str. J-07]|nr:hypothetical protein AGR8A_pTi20127 [Agrobacterium fabrum str. J-07]